MNTIKAKEATRFFRSYGLKCEENEVLEWVNESFNTIEKDGVRHPITEDDLYDFNDWNRYKGTAYERGIDDKTRINRLHDEVRNLKKEIEKLNREQGILNDQLDILPF